MNYKSDFYSIKAKKLFIKARSYFKLEEIDKKFDLIKKNQKILDLGCYPGSWTQYCFQKAKEIKVVGIDLQETILHFNHFSFYQKNIFTLEKQFFETITDSFPFFDGIISDAAPKTTGIKSKDSYQSFELAIKAINLADFLIKKNGFIVIKYLVGEEFKELKKTMSQFQEIKYFKPKSSRKNSTEIFIIGEKK